MSDWCKCYDIQLLCRYMVCLRGLWGTNHTWSDWKPFSLRSGWGKAIFSKGKVHLWGCFDASAALVAVSCFLAVNILSFHVCNILCICVLLFVAWNTLYFYVWGNIASAERETMFGNWSRRNHSEIAIHIYQAHKNVTHIHQMCKTYQQKHTNYNNMKLCFISIKCINTKLNKSLQDSVSYSWNVWI